MTYIDKLVLLVIQDRKLLMVREKDQTVPFLLWGKREENESDIDALSREVEEEIGVPLDVNSLQNYAVFETPAVGKPEGTFVRWTCYFGDILWLPIPSSEIEEILYVAYDDRPQNNALACAVFEKLREDGLV